MPLFTLANLSQFIIIIIITVDSSRLQELPRSLDDTTPINQRGRIFSHSGIHETEHTGEHHTGDENTGDENTCDEEVPIVKIGPTIKKAKKSKAEKDSPQPAPLTEEQKLELMR